MSLAFRKILIPVDFSTSTDVAVEKALELVEPGGNIHLLHVQYYGYPGLSPSAYRFIWPNEKRDYETARQKLEKLRNKIQADFTHISVSYEIDNLNDLEQGVIRAAEVMNASLVIIGSKSRYTWLPFMRQLNPARLIRRMNTPIMMLRPGASSNKLRKIVVSLEPDMGREKLDLIQAICRKGGVKVYFLSFASDQNHTAEIYKPILLKCYETLKGEAGHQLENAVIYGKDKAASILQFARKIDGDLVVVPAALRFSKRWPRPRLFDVLDPSSKIGVLLV